jgi:SAM-dependent methyltransferase
LLLEDTYARLKRLDFVAQIARGLDSLRILDVGCGTGSGLTNALGAAFPTCEVIGVDSDAVSIARAQSQPHCANVRFVLGDSVERGDGFSLVIAAEVLEHVNDPVRLLKDLVAYTRPGGSIVITVPNGYGPFELCSLVEVCLNLSGLQRVLRSIKRAVSVRPAAPDAPAPLTLAISPHVNFFSYRELLGLFDAVGLTVTQYRASSFLCGYGLDLLIRGPKAIGWNAQIADRLPTWCVSDWMFELRPGGEERRSFAWRRTGWASLRRRLNLMRWGLS